MKRKKTRLTKEQILEKKLKREKRIKIFWSLFLVAIMTLSILQISFYNHNNNTSFAYNKLKLVSLNPDNPNYGFSRFAILNKNNELLAYVSYLPNYFDSINNETKENLNNIFNSINKSKYFGIIFNPKSRNTQQIDLFRFRLLQDITNIDKINNKQFYVIYGVVNKDKNYNLPKLTCDNSSVIFPIINLIPSNSSFMIEKNNYCFNFYFTSLSDLIILHDFLIYRIIK